MKLDIEGLERVAQAADQDEWRWRRDDVDVLEGVHDGQVVMFCGPDLAGRPEIVASIANRAHIAAASPPVVLALIGRIRGLEGVVAKLETDALDLQEELEVERDERRHRAGVHPRGIA